MKSKGLGIIQKFDFYRKEFISSSLVLHHSETLVDRINWSMWEYGTILGFL
uniref:Uncharacterized protein n=1 Tax=Lepeophtheirus salmonis TaxID=72036 RepID=A0A0K2U570_LEPSM